MTLETETADDSTNMCSLLSFFFLKKSPDFVQISILFDEADPISGHRRWILIDLR